MFRTLYTANAFGGQDIFISLQIFVLLAVALITLPRESPERPVLIKRQSGRFCLIAGYFREKEGSSGGPLDERGAGMGVFRGSRQAPSAPARLRPVGMTEHHTVLCTSFCFRVSLSRAFCFRDARGKGGRSVATGEVGTTVSSSSGAS